MVNKYHIISFILFFGFIIIGCSSIRNENTNSNEQIINNISQGNEAKENWLFVYWMPYDNNLSRYGEPIIKMIEENIKSDNLIVTIQADYVDNHGMKRYKIDNNGISVTIIDNEYSASIDTYKEYLEWIKDTFLYDKLAVVFLDHGGKLDEVCLDEKPTYQFLKIDELKSVFLDVFGKNSIDLLFFQVCTKGVIEALYEFKDIAEYTLSSQIELGAPNYYYPELFSSFSEKEISSGFDVAELIIKNERNDMYNSYTLVNNFKMNNLYSLFSVFCNQISGMNINPLVNPLNLHYYDELYWDIISLLELFPNIESRNNLINYIKDELIIMYKISPLRQRTMGSYSGLSISGVKDNKYNKLNMYELLEPIRNCFH